MAGATMAHTMSEPLEQRVVGALSDGDATASGVAALLAEAANAAQEAETAARTARERAFDPLVSPNISKARAAAEDAALARDRLQGLLPRLQTRLEDLQAAEHAAAWQDDYENVRAAVEAEAHRFREIERLFAAILERLAGAAALQPDIDRVNRTAPAGEPKRLKSVELTARQLDTFSTDSPSLARELRIPEWIVSCRLAFPRRVAPTITVAPQLGADADWADSLRQRGQAVREESERVAAFYEKQPAA